MSARFTAVFEGETFEIEITSDGELSFPGHDEQLEYEIAYAAMGGKPSAAMRLLDEWESIPMAVVYSNLSVSLGTMLGFMGNLERMAGQHGSKGFSFSAQASFDTGKNRARVLRHYMLENQDTWSSDVEPHYHRARFLGIASQYTEVAAIQQTGHSDSYRMHHGNTQDFLDAESSERARQVRHFVRIMEALQAGQEWPEIPEVAS